jgi:hypothetical protein
MTFMIVIISSFNFSKIFVKVLHTLILRIYLLITFICFKETADLYKI